MLLAPPPSPPPPPPPSPPSTSITTTSITTSTSTRAAFSVEGGQSKGQHGSELLRSPVFPPPLRNSPCIVRFWLCSGGHQKGVLSLWLVQNTTGPEEQPLWRSTSELRSERGWKRVTLPLYGLADWFWLQFSTEDGPGPSSAISLDNISFSMNCFLALQLTSPPSTLTPWLQRNASAVYNGLDCPLLTSKVSPDWDANGEFPPVATSTTRLLLGPTNQNIRTTTPSNGSPPGRAFPLDDWPSRAGVGGVGRSPSDRNGAGRTLRTCKSPPICLR
ncbi:hypothetical protein CRUP_019799 [Coryphaenoides rupestris]|nr:hypothetical protein CRUP_019799 [Coryphaenoides rupestris]